MKGLWSMGDRKPKLHEVVGIAYVMFGAKCKKQN